MFSASKASPRKLFHTSMCRHAKCITTRNLITFASFPAAVEAGFHQCPHCSPVRAQYVLEQKDFSLRCSCYQYDYKFVGGSLQIQSSMDEWRIIPADGEYPLLLLHKNTREDESKSVMPGYHLQPIKQSVICGYLDYIKEHDRFRESRMHTSSQPPKGSKRWRKQQKKIKNEKRRNEIRRTLDLIDRLTLT